MAIYYGFNPPFKGGQQNILSRQEDEQLIKNDLLQLLMTIPGERVYRPFFGVPLRSFVFENATRADVELLRHNVREAIEKNDERILVHDVDAELISDENKVRIKITFSLRNDPKSILTIDRFIKVEA